MLRAILYLLLGLTGLVNAAAAFFFCKDVMMILMLFTAGTLLVAGVREYEDRHRQRKIIRKIKRRHRWIPAYRLRKAG